MSFPLPSNESERLRELHGYDFLDSAPDEALEEIVNLVKDICEVPIAVISVIDETRQWFKVKVGTETVETLRDVAFCAHAICEASIFLVPDAALDRRFQKNPLVTGDPHIRFYAGAPLLTPSGNALGTLCVIDQKPRELSPQQQRILVVLSRQVVMQLELKRHIAEGRKAEQALARAHADLEIRVHQRTEQLYEACERAQAEIVVRIQSEAALQHRNAQLLGFEAALLRLATTRHSQISDALRHVVAIALDTLEVGNASIWRFDKTGERLRSLVVCNRLAQATTTYLSSDREINQSDCPNFFLELRQNLPVFVADIQTSDLRNCWKRVWPQANQIGSLFGVPIRVSGTLIGTLLLGDPQLTRVWDAPEKEFADSLASVIALALEAEERQQAEVALKESRSRLELAVDAARVGLWEQNLQTGDAWFSDEWKRQLGFEPPEVPDRLEEWWSRVHPEDREQLERKTHDLQGSGSAPSSDIEFRIQHRDGSWLWLLGRARLELDEHGRPLRIYGCHIDVTARHMLEKQLHALAAHLDQVREDERIGLARELHDELGQILTALRMDVAWLAKASLQPKESVVSKIPQRLGVMKDLIDQAISSVQRIATDLRPGMLVELGLVPALEWQVEDFEKRSGIAMSFSCSVEETDLGPVVARAFYRALQEALTNVARHAEASAVEVVLLLTPANSTLQVRDNGRGMPLDAPTAAKSLGLIGMRERAWALGGDIVLSATPGGGTTVSMTLPTQLAPTMGMPR